MAASGSGAARVRRRRDKMRLAGLRPVQIWVPDIRAAGFGAECTRQARLIRDSEAADPAGDETWFEAADKTGWSE